MTMDTNTLRTAAIYIPLLTGSLSVIGSGSILYSIWASRSTKLKDPQHRILGMMSIFDMLYSVNKALMFLTYPAGLGVPTFGNDTTCALQGFFIQFAYATGSYNMVLSIYYYLSINWGMKKEEFAKVWEKVLNGIIIICHLSFAIISVSIGLINPTSGFCYITSGPYDCTTNPDVSCPFENSAELFHEAFGQAWIQLAYVVIVVTNLLIWLHVRRQEKEMEKYRTRSVAAEQLSDMEKKSSYTKSVFTQSMLYVGAFFLTWSWATIYHLVALITGVRAPWIILLINTFVPLQGFWNAFIYARPRYLRLKKKNKHMGFKQLIKLVFFPSNDDSTGPSSSAGKPKWSSNFFSTFLSRSNFLSGASVVTRSSLSRRKTTDSHPAGLETDGAEEKIIVLPDSKTIPEEAKEETVTRSDSKPIHNADEETGNVGFVLPSEEEKNEEEEKVEEGDEFIDSPSLVTLERP